jgi:hypothetical protein
MKQELIFVYNANSDFFSTVTGFAHKILSPATYQCHLCALTFGNFSIKEGWKSIIEDFSLKAIFLHKDEFEGKYGIYPPLPAVFISSNETIKQLISKQEIENCWSLEELKDVLMEKVKAHVQHYHSNI